MKNIKDFIECWKNHGDEKSETQKFWLEFLSEVCGVDEPTKSIDFEKRVELKHKSFIDGYVLSTRIIIEQKSFDVDLDKSEKQSDGTFLTPFEQAKRYYDWLPKSEKGNYIVVCNFQEFRIHDMEHPKAKPEIIKLENLEREWRKFLFLIDVNALSPKDIHEEEISIKAGELVKKLKSSLKSRYKNSVSKNSLKSLTILCVRIVFLLYAEDSGLFNKNQFHDFLKKQNNPRRALIDLFEVLSQKIGERDFYLDEDLKNFPYVNGGLFEEKNIEIPLLDGEPLEIILNEMSEGFDWSGINPTIFGAIFESVLDSDERRSGGMHYTSIENIHKVIDPLFLDELKKELEDFINLPSATKKQKESKTKKFIEFQDKLSKLKFFDPACGSGNFLTETYLSLRRLENRGLEELMNQQINFASGDFTPIKISLGQFFGIEINDFAVAVARTALWIAESQMMNETKNIIQIADDVLPLKNFNNVIEANALTFDWTTLVKSDELNFIMGNPPFIGQSVRTKEQSDEMSLIWGKGEIETKLDYVICWYKKAVDFMKNTKIKAAFVSTNSICQGESVPTFWKKMIDSGIVINFAYRAFVWTSEAVEKAAVHCVIVGFSNFENNEAKFIFDGENKIEAAHINPYLYDAPDIWIMNRINKPQNGLPKMTTGNPPTDDGGLLLTADEKRQIETKYPILKKYIRPFIGAREFLHDKLGEFSRYCLWFKDGNPSDYAKIPEIKERFQKVKVIREKSNADRIKKMADFPSLFCQIRQPDSTYLVIPRVSSENRKYIPIGFISPEIIASDACSIIPDVSIYEFAILSSSVHMAWTKLISGRLEMRIRYSPAVYNNFVWPSVSEKQKSKIEMTAKKILEAREKFPESSLADLYDPLTMPEELLKAHKANDAAVCEAYGFSKDISEEEIVSELMSLYEKFSK